MWGYGVCSEVADRGSVIGVRPEVLETSSGQRHIVNAVTKRGTYPNGVLTTGADPRRLSEIEEHVRRLVESIDLGECFSDGGHRTDQIHQHTSMNTVPFWLSPLQYWAG